MMEQANRINLSYELLNKTLFMQIKNKFKHRYKRYVQANLTFITRF